MNCYAILFHLKIILTEDKKNYTVKEYKAEKLNFTNVDVGTELNFKSLMPSEIWGYKPVIGYSNPVYTIKKNDIKTDSNEYMMIPIISIPIFYALENTAGDNFITNGTIQNLRLEGFNSNYNISNIEVTKELETLSDGYNYSWKCNAHNVDPWSDVKIEGENEDGSIITKPLEVSELTNMNSEMYLNCKREIEKVTLKFRYNEDFDFSKYNPNLSLFNYKIGDKVYLSNGNTKKSYEISSITDLEDTEGKREITMSLDSVYKPVIFTQRDTTPHIGIIGKNISYVQRQETKEEKNEEDNKTNENNNYNIRSGLTVTITEIDNKLIREDIKTGDYIKILSKATGKDNIKYVITSLKWNTENETIEITLDDTMFNYSRRIINKFEAKIGQNSEKQSVQNEDLTNNKINYLTSKLGTKIDGINNKVDNIDTTIKDLQDKVNNSQNGENEDIVIDDLKNENDNFVYDSVISVGEVDGVFTYDNMNKYIVLLSDFLINFNYFILNTNISTYFFYYSTSPLTKIYKNNDTTWTLKNFDSYPAPTSYNDASNNSDNGLNKLQYAHGVSEYNLTVRSIWEDYLSNIYNKIIDYNYITSEDFEEYKRSFGRYIYCNFLNINNAINLKYPTDFDLLEDIKYCLPFLNKSLDICKDLATKDTTLKERENYINLMENNYKQIIDLYNKTTTNFLSKYDLKDLNYVGITTLTTYTNILKKAKKIIFLSNCFVKNETSIQTSITNLETVFDKLDKIGVIGNNQDRLSIPQYIFNGLHILKINEFLKYGITLMNSLTYLTSEIKTNLTDLNTVFSTPTYAWSSSLSRRYYAKNLTETNLLNFLDSLIILCDVVLEIEALVIKNDMDLFDMLPNEYTGEELNVKQDLLEIKEILSKFTSSSISETNIQTLSQTPYALQEDNNYTLNLINESLKLMIDYQNTEGIQTLNIDSKKEKILENINKIDLYLNNR